MDLNTFESMVNISSGLCTLLGYLPKFISKVQHIISSNGHDFITNNDETVNYLKEYLNYKKTKDEKKRCKAVLKKYHLPNSVGIMCKSENDVCFAPNKSIVYTCLNNLNLKSTDSFVNLSIGGGCFSLVIESLDQGIIHPSKIMNGTVIRYKDQIYLLRHPLGGFPNYLAKVDLFINGMIIEFDDGCKVGVYYQT